MSNLRAVAKGNVLYSPKNVEDGLIEIGSSNISIPAVLFCFWNQFHEMCRVEEAKRSFQQAGLPEKLFDLSMEALVSAGLISVYDDNGEYTK